MEQPSCISISAPYTTGQSVAPTKLIPAHVAAPWRKLAVAFGERHSVSYIWVPVAIVWLCRTCQACFWHIGNFNAVLR